MQHALPSGHTHLVLQHLITTIQIMQHVLPSGHTHLVLQNLIIKITHKDYQSAISFSVNLSAYSLKINSITWAISSRPKEWPQTLTKWQLCLPGQFQHPPQLCTISWG